MALFCTSVLEKRAVRDFPSSLQSYSGGSFIILHLAFAHFFLLKGKSHMAVLIVQSHAPKLTYCCLDGPPRLSPLLFTFLPLLHILRT